MHTPGIGLLDAAVNLMCYVNGLVYSFTAGITQHVHYIESVNLNLHDCGRFSRHEMFIVLHLDHWVHTTTVNGPIDLMA